MSGEILFSGRGSSFAGEKGYLPGVLPAPHRHGPPRSVRVQRVAETGVALALATVLSLVVLVRFPGGGSVTLGAVVPLWVLARRHGAAHGVLAGGAFGAVQLALGSGVVHPVQALLDYPLAYATQGLLGVRRWPWPVVLVGALAARILVHTLAAPFFLGDLDGAAVLRAGLVYNAGFLLPDGVLAALIWRGIAGVRPDLDRPRDTPADPPG